MQHGNMSVIFYQVGCQVNMVTYLINWSSVGSVHDSIIPSLSVGCQMSVRL